VGCLSAVASRRQCGPAALAGAGLSIGGGGSLCLRSSPKFALVNIVRERGLIWVTRRPPLRTAARLQLMADNPPLVGVGLVARNRFVAVMCSLQQRVAPSDPKSSLEQPDLQPWALLSRHPLKYPHAFAACFLHPLIAVAVFLGGKFVPWAPGEGVPGRQRLRATFSFSHHLFHN